MDNSPHPSYNIVSPSPPTPTAIDLDITSETCPPITLSSSPEAYELPNIAQLFASIQPPVDDETFNLIQLGLTQPETPPPDASDTSPHLAMTDLANFTFIKSLRAVFITLLHARFEDLDDKGGGDDWVYRLLDEFNVAEEKVREYWEDQALPFPETLNHAFLRLRSAMMSPPGCSFAERVVMFTDWPRFIMMHFDQPGRKWVKERFPLLTGGKTLAWEPFSKVMQAGFAGCAVPVMQEEEQPRLVGLERARRVAESVLEEDFWEDEPGRRYDINLTIVID
jgi:hypothetical protein